MTLVRTRREFLRDSALGSATLVAGLTACGAPRSEETAIEPGLQLYTVRDLLESDFAGTLQAVAELGYHEVQVSPRAGKTPTEIRGWLDDAGLVCPSIHLDPRSSIEAEIEAASILGARFVFLSAPVEMFVVKDGRYSIRTDASLDLYRRVADGLNETGARFREAGLVYGYHNHAFEFTPIEGQLPFDLILEGTEADLVAIEIDLGWAKVGGIDVVDYFRRYPGRFPVCHVKDVLADGTFVDPGAGTVDFAAAFAEASTAGLQHFFVEHDTTKDPLGTARAGHAYLTAARRG
jgi:sugar phosphate isomerase/epimerase